VAFVTAFAASLTLAFFLRGSAAKPTRWGGLAVLIAVVVAVALAYGWAAFFTLRAFWLSLGILFVMGVVDDLLVLRPSGKLLFQVAAALLFVILTSPTAWAPEIRSSLGVLSLPVLLLWIVGITNSLNLLDNMDGLAAGVGTVAALGFVRLEFGADWVLIPLAGALAGFLVLNFSPARIYLGDAGSHLLGFSLAVLPLYGQPSGNLWCPVVVLLAPIADTSFVTVTRLARGISPFRGGKDHLSHRLRDLGVSERLVAALFWLVTLLLAAAAGGF
jgi:UDP-GlcNAc:undecaprenyl-phosphate/decaprenyl-phosphate GlcNAc-1-phosphate transferase